MAKKILIATGGTGGHIYPAIALAQQLNQTIPGCEVLFVGGGLEKNRYFDHKTFPYCSVACGSFVKKDPLSVLKSCRDIGRGVWQSSRIIGDFKPDVAVGFGSFYSFPPLVAAKLHFVPIILHEANSIPGKVNRLLSSYAAISSVHFPQTLSMLNGTVVEVGMPLRIGYTLSSISPDKAKKHFGLDPKPPLLLVFGGSQGAQCINSCVVEAVLQIHQTLPLQVLHIVGDHSLAKQMQEVYLSKNIPAKVKAYEDRMDLAWQAADMVIARAGAGTVAEQLEFEVPGILIPYHRAADNHQEHNADFMLKTVGGAIKLLEDQLDPAILAQHLISIWPNTGTYQQMKGAMKDYKLRSRRKDLCALVKEVLNS